MGIWGRLGSPGVTPVVPQLMHAAGEEKASRTFQLRSDTMMTLHRTGSEACTSQMTSDAFKINGDATEIIKHFYQEAVESISLMYLGCQFFEFFGAGGLIGAVFS